jgi:hypothetical protein
LTPARLGQDRLEPGGTKKFTASQGAGATLSPAADDLHDAFANQEQKESGHHQPEQDVRGIQQKQLPLRRAGEQKGNQ